MRFLIQDVLNFNFYQSQLEEIVSKYEIDYIEKDEKYSSKYYVFKNINTIEELNTFVKKCGCHIVYGDEWEANGVYYPVIEIYDTYRE